MIICCCCCSVTQSCLTLWPNGLQQDRLLCPSPSPGLCSNSCPLSRWCHPTISSSVTPFSSFLILIQLQGLFKWVSSLCQVGKILALQLHNQSFQWTPRADLLGLVDLLAIQGTFKSLLQHHSSKASILWASAFFMVQLSHPYMTIGKTIVLIYGPLSANLCLCFLICCLGWS